MDALKKQIEDMILVLPIFDRKDRDSIVSRQHILLNGLMDFSYHHISVALKDWLYSKGAFPMPKEIIEETKEISRRMNQRSERLCLLIKACESQSVAFLTSDKEKFIQNLITEKNNEDF